MNQEEAKVVARAIKDALPADMRDRLKAIDVITRLHDGMCTVRLYMYNKVAEDPKPYNFAAKEL
jgi:hypothetical protein